MSKNLALQQLEQEMGMSALQLEHDFINFDKAKIKETAATLQQSVTDGYTSEIDALIFGKKIGTLAEELDTRIRPLVNGKSYGKDYERFGVKVTESMQGVKYDFTHCMDNQWLELYTQVKLLTEKLKERETFLKTISKEITIVDPDSGEVITLYPPVKSGKLGFMLSIK